MGPVRRTISLICALALTGASAYAFVYLIFYVGHYKFYMPAVAGVLTFVGLYWLYTDFINADPRPEK
jgi:hypothetical protein